jgi:hypothetical protein
MASPDRFPFGAGGGEGALRAVLESWASGLQPRTADVTPLDRALAYSWSTRRLEAGPGG